MWDSLYVNPITVLQENHTYKIKQVSAYNVLLKVIRAVMLYTFPEHCIFNKIQQF